MEAPVVSLWPRILLNRVPLSPIGNAIPKPWALFLMKPNSFGFLIPLLTLLIRVIRSG